MHCCPHDDDNTIDKQVLYNEMHVNHCSYFFFHTTRCITQHNLIRFFKKCAKLKRNEFLFFYRILTSLLLLWIFIFSLKRTKTRLHACFLSMYGDNLKSSLNSFQFKFMFLSLFHRISLRFYFRVSHIAKITKFNLKQKTIEI